MHERTWMSYAADASTVLRFLCIPFVVMLIAQSRWMMAAMVFTFAAMTDVVDGLLARASGHAPTWIGLYMDPGADKLLAVACFGMLWMQGRLPGWFLSVSLGKEVIMILGAAWLMVGLPKDQSLLIEHSIWGKFSAASQFMVGGIGVWGMALGYTGQLGQLWMIASIALQVAALISYAPKWHAAWGKIRPKVDQKQGRLL